MTAQVIDGAAFAETIRAQVAAEVGRLGHLGVTPGLAVVLVGDDPASRVYVRSKTARTVEAGMRSFDHSLPEDVSEADLLDVVRMLNADDAVDGILVQLPLPRHVDSARILDAMDPKKDVDGFHPVNAGLLMTGSPALVPCTPLGCLLLLRSIRPDLTGLDAVVVGRSNIVGKPMAQLLLAEGCTVTIAHSRTRDLPALCRRADILVAAVGRPEMIRGDWVKSGAIVIDVGINRMPAPERGEGRTKLVGDVAYPEAAAVAAAITPVPGGIGPMTIACLLANTVRAACLRRGIAPPDLGSAVAATA